MDERIIPFTYRPVTDKRRAFPLFFALVGIAAVLVVASLVIPVYRGLVSVGGVFFLTAAVLIYQRYVTSDYSYSVTEGGNGRAVFVASKRVGNRVSTIAYAELYALKSIQSFTKEELKKRATEKGVIKYNLIPTYSPDRAYLMTIKNANGIYEVLVDITEEVKCRLIEYAGYALADEAKRRDEMDNGDSDESTDDGGNYDD